MPKIAFSAIFFSKNWQQHMIKFNLSSRGSPQPGGGHVQNQRSPNTQPIPPPHPTPNPAPVQPGAEGCAHLASRHTCSNSAGPVLRQRLASVHATCRRSGPRVTVPPAPSLLASRRKKQMSPLTTSTFGCSFE